MVKPKPSTTQRPQRHRWLWVLLLILLLLLLFWLTIHRPTSTKTNSFTKNNIACVSNGYTAVYYPFKGVLNQQIILENVSGVKSSLNKFLTTQIKYGNQALIDIQGLTCLNTLEIPHTSRNNITDLTPLAKLTNLKVLMITNTNTHDISPLGQLSKLESLTINLDYPVDLTPLHNLNRLEKLTVCGKWVNESCTETIIHVLPTSPKSLNQYPAEFSILAKTLPRLKITFGF